MKKNLKFFMILSSLYIVTINSLLVTGCSLFGHEFNRNDNVSMLQYNIPGEHDFILKYETEIAKKASTASINEFNELYDNNNKSNVLWTNFNALQNELLNTKMGTFTSKDNWDKLFKQEGVSSNIKNLAENNLLRLYNIIGQLYSRKVVTKLIQSITKVSANDNVIAWTNYNSHYNNLRMGFDSDCFNSSFIDQEYQEGWWASDDITSVITHEFGHALDTYLTLDDKSRTTINDDWTVNSNDECVLASSVVLQHNSLSLKHHDPIFDCTKYFMNYLNQKGNIAPNNKIETILFPLIVVRSNFGRGYWINLDSTNISKDELFAEAFNEWILTPQSQRNWNWELLNDFFMDYIPKNFILLTN